MDIFGPGAHRLHVLFVCTANIDRSKTAEDLYGKDPRFEVKSCGVAPFAQVVITREMLEWADHIFVMNESEDHHVTAIRRRFPGMSKEVIDLDIEDRWKRGHPELANLIMSRLGPHIGKPQVAPSANPQVAPSANPQVAPSANPQVAPSANPQVAPSANPER